MAIMDGMKHIKDSIIEYFDRPDVKAGIISGMQYASPEIGWGYNPLVSQDAIKNIIDENTNQTPNSESHNSKKSLGITGLALICALGVMGNACEKVPPQNDPASISMWSRANNREGWLYDSSTGDLLKDEIGEPAVEMRYNLFQQYGDNWEDTLNVNGIEFVPIQPPKWVMEDPGYTGMFPPTE